MELDYMNNHDYYYNNQTFLPNVSPSASSLDSGYCGPASVQSSIESPHSHLGKEFYLLFTYHSGIITDFLDILNVVKDFLFELCF